MEISDIIKDAAGMADKYDLQMVEIDRTENIINLNLLIDHELLIQIYGNVQKAKINLALIFKNQRLYGFDSEGGRYHCHPIGAPNDHIFVEKRKSIEEFVQESMKFLEEREIL